MITRSERLLTHIFLIAFAAVVLVPIVGVVLAALHPPDQQLRGFSIPRELFFGNFERAWTVSRFGVYMRNSLIITLAVTTLTSVTSVLAGYALGTLRLRGDRAVLILLLGSIIMPTEAMIIPLFFNLRNLGLTDTYWAVILPAAAQWLAFGTFWMRAYFLSVPRAIVEAARIDGASTWATLWRVLLPMGRPALLTMILILAMWSWNVFLLPLVMITDESLRTVTLGLGFFQTQFEVDIRGITAASVIIALPVVTLYVFLQRHFIRGLMTGALKE